MDDFVTLAGVKTPPLVNAGCVILLNDPLKSAEVRFRESSHSTVGITLTSPMLPDTAY